MAWLDWLVLGTKRTKSILVYQMGRVGSVSVRDGLLSAGIPQVIHAHYLQSQGEHYKRRGLPDKLPRTIVSLVRDPLARNLSEFLRRINPQESWTGKKLVKVFLRDFNHIWPFVWWKQELSGYLGVDVLGLAFNNKSGFAVYEQAHFRLLILKTETLQTSAPVVLGKFVGRDEVPIPHKNRTDYDPERLKLREFFMAEFAPSEALLDWYYDNPTVQHFYSPSQVNNFRNKWTKEKQDG